MKLTKQWQDIEGRVNLAGVQWSDYQRLSSNVLKPGLVLKLFGEPHSQAIYVEYAGYKLGYIPKGTLHKPLLWMFHKSGYKCIAVLTAFNKTNPTWSMITVQLKRKAGKLTKPPEVIVL